MNNIHILVLGPIFKIKGPLPKIVPLFNQTLREIGFAVDCLNWARHADEETSAQKIKNRVLDFFTAVVHILRHRPGRIYIHTTHFDWPAVLRDLPFLLFIRPFRPPLALVFHGSRSDCLIYPGNFFLKLCSWLEVALADAVFVLSSQELVEWHSFLPGAKIYQASNPFVRSSTLTTNPRSFSNRPLELLFVGRYVKEKGIFDLLTALAQLQDHDYHLRIAGFGPAEEEIRNYVERYGLADRVDVIGYQVGTTLDNLYRQSDILVLPSWSEGFPTVLLEAMDFGLAIISTNIRGARDILINGENGILVPPHAPEKIAAAIDYLAKSPEKSLMMSEMNFRKLNAYLPEKVIAAYLSF